MKSLCFAATVALLAIVGSASAKRNVNPAILPPDSKPYGHSYGEWSARWWQWTLSLPVTGHPLFDETGADAGAGQSGPVWFLGGTFTTYQAAPEHVVGTATRNITVPHGKALFFPVVNNETDNVGVEPPMTVEELRTLAKYNQDHAANLTCTIDGRAVEGLADPLNTHYRVTSPVFSFTLPEEDNLYQFFGFDVSGTQSPAVADGVFVMLAPLSAGQHAIHFSGALVFTMEEDGFALLFELDITYNITVR